MNTETLQTSRTEITTLRNVLQGLQIELQSQHSMVCNDFFVWKSLVLLWPYYIQKMHFSMFTT